jgi:hypothetical protein
MRFGIADSQGSALSVPGGFKDWACLPRFNSGSTFARLLDGRTGQWGISPAERFQVSLCYLDGTMVLRITYA